TALWPKGIRRSGAKRAARGRTTSCGPRQRCIMAAVFASVERVKGCEINFTLSPLHPFTLSRDMERIGMTTIWPGKPYPLGATCDAKGVNFALFSQHATGVELCVFDPPSPSSRSRSAPRERERISMTEQTDNVWHVYLPGARPGLLYGYRVYGPYDPEHG